MEYTKEEAITRFLLDEDLQDFDNWVDASNIIVTDSWQIHSEITEFKTEQGTYIVGGDYDQLENMARSYVLDLIEDIGLIDAFGPSFDLSRYIVSDYFEEIENEYHKDTFFELTDEEQDNYKDDIEYAELMMSGDSYSWYLDLGFDLKHLLKTNPMRKIIDIDWLVSDVVDMDGVAHTLASYDGNEYEQDGYWIYRTN